MSPLKEEALASSSPKEVSQGPGAKDKNSIKDVGKEEDTIATTSDKKKDSDPLATVREVFSFAQTNKVKVWIAIGTFCAAVTGCTFPAMAWIFSDSFQRLSGADVPEFDFMAEMRELAFQLLVLGAIICLFMTLSAGLLEASATEMSETMKKQWFEALLRQDMAYYDISDVSGTATIINTNGRKFKKCVSKHV
eukprot:scaffold24289_cov147-Cylindrotheca_fusiformis.AAC.1